MQNYFNFQVHAHTVVPDLLTGMSSFFWNNLTLISTKIVTAHNKIVTVECWACRQFLLCWISWRFTIKIHCFGGGLGGSVRHPTLDFSWDHGLGAVRSSLASGSVLGMEPAWDSFSPHFSLLFLSLSLVFIIRIVISLFTLGKKMFFPPYTWRLPVKLTSVC